MPAMSHATGRRSATPRSGAARLGGTPGASLLGGGPSAVLAVDRRPGGSELREERRVVVARQLLEMGVELRERDGLLVGGEIVEALPRGKHRADTLVAECGGALDGAAETRPMLHLPGDRAAHDAPLVTGPVHESIGKLDGGRHGGLP